MEYIRTRNKEKIFTFKDVFLKGLAPDGGLFVPKVIPFYSFRELKKLKTLSYKELAAEIAEEDGKVKELIEQTRMLLMISWLFYPVAYIFNLAGGTAEAVAKLITKLGANIQQITFFAELSFLPGREVLSNYSVNSILKF